MMYGESRFMHFWVDILIVLYIFGFGTARLGEWRLNHIHSINGAEVSVSDSSAEIDYSYVSAGQFKAHKSMEAYNQFASDVNVGKQTGMGIQ